MVEDTKTGTLTGPMGLSELTLLNTVKGVESVTKEVSELGKSSGGLIAILA